MRSSAKTVNEYLDSVPEDRKDALENLRDIIVKNLPNGFSEEMSYGMIGYVVPHSIYPGGYHCDPELPLPFMNLASQKNYIAVYHSGIYADDKLLNWFKTEYIKIMKKKPDMGKSCIRFKNINQIPYELIGDLASKINPQQWIKIYEKAIKR